MFDRRLEIKTREQIAIMRRAGLVVGETLSLLRDAVAPGVTTLELDALAEDHIRARGATPNFLNYHGFPATICTSVNDEVVHGIPGSRVLSSGDLISIDCGAIVDGWHGDAAITVAVGEISADVQKLMDVTEGSMWAGFAAARLGGRVTDISHAVEGYIRSQAHPSGGSYGILEDFTGHGIGTAFHSGLIIPHYDDPRFATMMEPGMTFTIEPMINAGKREIKEDAKGGSYDGWTIVTRDHSLSAQWEHTVLVTESGYEVLTLSAGSPPPPAFVNAAA